MVFFSVSILSIKINILNHCPITLQITFFYMFERLLNLPIQLILNWLKNNNNNHIGVYNKKVLRLRLRRMLFNKRINKLISENCKIILIYKKIIISSSH